MNPDWIYLSPHLDDAVLSCGGQIAQRARAGERIWVVTVFAGSPRGGLSPLAGSFHQWWGLGADAPAARRKEDRAALALVAARPVHWRLQDCIYRRTAEGVFLYPDQACLWGPLHPQDEELVPLLARRMARLPRSATLCVPLAAGRHVDHRLVRQGAEATGRPLLYYEDYPYAEVAQAVETALGQGPWTCQEVPLGEEALAAKVAAVRCYRSQLSTFWADEEEMEARIRAYAVRVGDGPPAERYWRRL